MTKKRNYCSQSRQLQAEDTKKRILNISRELFRERGFSSVTIEEIAQAAGVSAATIYAQYQSKRGVLLAIMDAVAPQTKVGELISQGMQEKSPAKRIRYGAKIARCIYDAERAELDFFQSAAVLAPEFKELEKEREMRRYDRQEESMRELWKQKAFLPGLTLKQARDILWSLTGRDMYRMLVVDKGWSSQAYEKWLGDLLVKTLIKNSIVEASSI